MAVRHHLLDVYDVHLHVAGTKRDWKQLSRKVGQKLDSLDGVKGYATFFGDGTDGHLCFYLDAHMAPAKRVQYAAHEAAHGAGLIFDGIRAEYDWESEPFAWLVGWLTRWLYES